MFRKILIPVDLSEKNQTAVDAALWLVQQSGGTITLLHVIEVIEDSAFEELADFYRRLEDKAREGMRRLAAPLADAGVTVDQRVTYGRRAQGIVSFAAEQHPDLIVLSSRRMDPQHPAKGWAALSHQVAFFAQCPVLLVK